MKNHRDSRKHPMAQTSASHSKQEANSPLKESPAHLKRRKLASKFETSTGKPESNRSLHGSNRYEALRSCSVTSRHRKRVRRKSTSTTEFSRKWVYSPGDYSNSEDNIVVVSYNILGVQNALNHPDLYSDVSRKFLEWKRRKKLICEEMKSYSANVICFQEVDHFSDLDDLLQNYGFKGVYKARTGDAHDGCAVFWKDKLFTLVHQEDIEFRNFGLRDNVAQLCVLKINDHKTDTASGADAQNSVIPAISKSFVIGNIHVLFNPNRGDIKLGQVRLLLEKAYKLSQEWGDIPVILAGDLNSVPHSALYQYLASSKLNILQNDRRAISGQLKSPPCRFFSSRCNASLSSIQISNLRPNPYQWNDEELRLATGNAEDTHLQHHLTLSSAYIGVPGSRRTRDSFGEPLATSYHSKFMGTVDYIWHTEELIPVRVLETLPIETLKRTCGLPSENWGSDHLALVCEFAFATDSNGA